MQKPKKPTKAEHRQYTFTELSKRIKILENQYEALHTRIDAYFADIKRMRHQDLVTLKIFVERRLECE